MKQVFSAILLSLSLSSFSQNTSITYIANEGVLIESGSKKVMIDALFDQYYDAYLYPQEDVLEKMITGEQPYDYVDLILSTHIHRDHFAPTMTGRFLKNHPETQLISSQQLAQSVTNDYAEGKSLTEQLRGIVRDTAMHQHEVSGMRVTSFFIYHSGGSRNRTIENMGFLIDVNGTTILHLGDSDMSLERFQQLDLKSLGVDIALVPYWYMADETGVKILNETIQAQHLIGIHYPKVGSPMALKQIKEQFPQAKVFQTVGEQAEF